MHLLSTLNSVDIADCVCSFQPFFTTAVTIHFNIPVTIISGHFFLTWSAVRSLHLLFSLCIPEEIYFCFLNSSHFNFITKYSYPYNKVNMAGCIQSFYGFFLCSPVDLQCTVSHNRKISYFHINAICCSK